MRYQLSGWVEVPLMEGLTEDLDIWKLGYQMSK